MKKTVTINGKEISIQGLCWGHIKMLQELGVGIYEINPLAPSDGEAAILETICVSCTDLKKEELAQMEAADICSLFAEILNHTIETSRQALESILKRTKRNNLTVVK
jgi:hypothetical protein